MITHIFLWVNNMERVYEVKKRIKDKKIKQDDISNNKFKIFALKFFIVIILFSFGTILVKNDVNIKNTIYNNIYNKHFSFAFFKNTYNKYIGNIIPFQNIFKDKKVFNEKLEYKSLSKYNKGIKLKLNKNYIIPVIKDGIVIFSGNKEGLGKTIIIQGSDGIDIWYANLSNTKLKLYDYAEQNTLVGEAKNDELYMIFQKDGVEIDYKEVLK